MTVNETDELLLAAAEAVPLYGDTDGACALEAHGAATVTSAAAHATRRIALRSLRD